MPKKKPEYETTSRSWRLPKDVADAFAALADEHDRSVNRELLMVMVEHLRKHDRLPPRLRPKK